MRAHAEAGQHEMLGPFLSHVHLGSRNIQSDIMRMTCYASCLIETLGRRDNGYTVGTVTERLSQDHRPSHRLGGSDVLLDTAHYLWN